MLDLCNFAEIYILVSPTKKIYRPSEPPGAKIECPISTPGAETVECVCGRLLQLQEPKTRPSNPGLSRANTRLVK